MRLSILYGSDFGERFVSNLIERGFADSIYYVERIEVKDDVVDEYSIDLPKADVAVVIDIHPDILLDLPENLTHYKALIVPIERPTPKGFLNQLETICEDIGLELATPKPFCSLNPKCGVVKEFVEYFQIGYPIFKAQTIDLGDKIVISQIEVIRGQPCGLAWFVAEKLRGFVFRSRDELWSYLSELHHSYPCTASMQVDPDYGDTLLHVSGFTLREAIGKALKI